ncbi:hypothetical protein HYX06_03655 [Candidatus Woesearchaeota archaeon]|nr:hypothetical protein [Candidatus Woesearchaeota archaeon]
MQFLNYFLASIISYLGLLAGILLVKIAPEEQEPLRKYFEWLRKSILLMIFLFLIFYYSNSLAYIAALMVYFAFIIFIEYRFGSLLKKSIIIYTALGMIFYLSSKNPNLFAIGSSLIFLHGMPAASLMFRKKGKNYAGIFLHNLGFLAVANLAYFI